MYRQLHNQIESGSEEQSSSSKGRTADMMRHLMNDMGLTKEQQEELMNESMQEMQQQNMIDAIVM